MSIRTSRFLLLLVAFLSLFSCHTSQKVVVESEEDTINYFIEGKNLSQLHVDNLGNIYLVKNNRILQKYSAEGDLLMTYDDQSGGFIHSVDTNNPLYILIYFKDANRVTLLDRNFAVYSQLDISKWTQNDITAAGLSNDGKIWIYDNTERKLKKYTIAGKLVLESTDLYGLSALSTFVEHLIEHENRVYLRNQSGQLIVLDNLGGYINDKDFATSLPLTPRKGQICCPLFDKYSCIRLDDNPFQQVVAIEDLPTGHLESILYKMQLFHLIKGGVIRSTI